MSDFYLGCDVSKGYGDFVLLDGRKKVAEPVFQLDDTAEGHQKLCAFLRAFCSAHESAVVYAGLESTGGYENNWLALLRRLEGVLAIKVTRVDPLAVKRYREARKKTVTTDAVSASTIAHYLSSFVHELNFEHDTEFGSMRRQWNLIQLLMKQNTQLSNELGFLMYQSHPELVVYCKDGIPGWILQLIEKYPTAVQLGRAKERKLAEIAYITPERAKVLISDAKKTVASCTNLTDATVIKTAVKQVISLTEAIAIQKELLLKSSTTPDTKLIASIPGIGEYSAIGLMATFVEISRFASTKNLAAYCGMHPVFKESGDGKTVARMSKRGHSQPRAILYMCALSAVRCNPVIKETYERAIGNGMKPKAALGVCMHKLLRIIFGVLRSGRAFDPAIYAAHKRRSLRKPKAPMRNQKRRVQNYDDRAPISRRQSKRRGEEQRGKHGPQKNCVLKNGVTGRLVGKENTSIHANLPRAHSDPIQIGKIIKTLVEV